MLRPPVDIGDEIIRRVHEKALADRMSGELVPRARLHQSVSLKFDDTEANLAALRRVGGRLRAHAFEFVYNRIRNSGDGGHWVLLPRGEVPQFQEVRDLVQAELRSEELDVVGHTAHMTLAYGGGASPAESFEIAPIAWPVTEIELVRAGAQAEYGYDTLDRWPLKSPRQTALF
ncbi:2'-5' RNA ligase family protein [Luteimonas terrae]|uniref:2'-5' RNA ligase n=1 Tax=Luteimonas terrae TaxID=1530191 RepID=A0ABU1XZ55_9GAMM|nr:2'-5' RNA ligase family protein [Luteimonas terrae]MDR7194043.1 2'-5' RNA ligase [Luteimonas terrae]